MSANEALQDRAVDHAVDLQRYSTHVVRRMIEILNRSDARLAAQLAEALMRLDAGSFTVARLEALLQAVKATNAAALDEVTRALDAEVREFAAVEATHQAAAFRAVVPAAVALRFPIAAVTGDQLYAAAVSRPFQGRLLREWAQQVGEARMVKVRETVRMGYAEGQATADVIRAVRGTKALRFTDGVLDRSRRELATVVQTALSHTAQTARQAMVDANADLVKAVRWVSTLDSRTSPPCRVRDGLAYTPGDHKPVGHAVPWGAGPGRIHFNCRSVSVPVLKSWRELGIDADDMPAGTRASMDGQVPADLTFGQWFARQSAARQDEIVGAERGVLFRAGKATFDKFTDDKGKWLTLAQLEARIDA